MSVKSGVTDNVPQQSHVLTAASLATRLVRLSAMTTSGAWTRQASSFTGIVQTGSYDPPSSRGDEPVTLLHWELSRSMGASPRQLPLHGDLVHMTSATHPARHAHRSHDEAGGASPLVHAALEPQSCFLLHHPRQQRLVAVLRVRLPDVPATLVVPVRSSYGFVSDLTVPTSRSARCEGPCATRFFDDLQLRLVAWLLRSFSHDAQRTRVVSVIELEQAFPALLALSAARRRQFVEDAIERHAKEELRYFNNSIVRIRDTHFYLFPGDAADACRDGGGISRTDAETRQDRRRLVAFEFALVNVVLLTDMRLTELLQAAASCLRRLREVRSVSLAHCVAVVVQLLSPLTLIECGAEATKLSASLRAAVLGNLFGLLQGSAARLQDTLSALVTHEARARRQRRDDESTADMHVLSEAQLRALRLCLEHGSITRRGPYRPTQSTAIATSAAAPRSYEPSAFFEVSVLPEVADHSTFTLYPRSLKSAPMTLDELPTTLPFRLLEADTTLTALFRLLALQVRLNSADDLVSLGAVGGAGAGRVDRPRYRATVGHGEGAGLGGTAELTMDRLELYLGRRRSSPTQADAASWDSDDDIALSKSSSYSSNRRGYGGWRRRGGARGHPRGRGVRRV